VRALPIDYELGEFVDNGEWWDVPPEAAARSTSGAPPGWPPDEHIAANWGLSRCESPIEIHLGVAILKRLGCQELVPQYTWRGWRMDFAIVDGSDVLAFVECDGAAFHQGARRQNDRRKNAAAAQAGIPLLRFTGSEIYRDVQSCARKVHEAVEVECAARRNLFPTSPRPLRQRRLDDLPHGVIAHDASLDGETP
jgi:very-short-patch-repair endonuclease